MKKKGNTCIKKIINIIVPVSNYLKKLRTEYKNTKFLYIFLDDLKKNKKDKLKNFKNFNKVLKIFILQLIEFYKSKFNLKCNYIIILNCKIYDKFKMINEILFKSEDIII